MDGENPTLADAIIPKPAASAVFIMDNTSKYHYDNYRRLGEPNHQPQVGNCFTPLFWQPVRDVPDQIEVIEGVNTYTFTKGVHYFVVEDTTELAGTVRARNGIEWVSLIPAQTGADPDAGPFTGPLIQEIAGDTSVPIERYTYDRNIVDLQASLESNKQVTTDVLAHRSRKRYFKLDISVMYNPGASVTGTNLAIRDAVQTAFGSAFFGTIVQLSDLLQVIHNVGGVDNVRWSSDVPNQPATTRLVECDRFGNPLLNVLVDRLQMASVSRAVGDIQMITVTGVPTGGTFKLKYGASVSAAIAYNASGATMDTQVDGITGVSTTTVALGTFPPQYQVTFPGTAQRSLLEVTSLRLRVGQASSTVTSS